MGRSSVTRSRREPAPGEVKSWARRGTRIGNSKAKVGREGKESCCLALGKVKGFWAWLKSSKPHKDENETG